MADPDSFGWIGSILEGKVSIERVVGEGGFGLVYRGTHLGFREPVAVKCLKIPPRFEGDDRAQFLHAFLEEARLLHRLSRSTTGIVQALDVGAATSPSGAWAPFLVMEWLEGRTLEEHLRERVEARGTPPHTVEQAFELLAPAASAVAAAHEQGVAHRDIKPANLFLARVAGATTIKVLDFGVAKIMTETASLTRALAQTGGNLRGCSPQYAAPEQYSQRFGATGPWTDVFAFGLVLLEAASGRTALLGQDALQLFVSATDRDTRPTFREWGVAATPAMEAVLSRALAVEPARRFRNLREMWAALGEAVADKGAGSVPTVSVRVSHAARGPAATQEASLPLLPTARTLPVVEAPDLGAGRGAGGGPRADVQGHAADGTVGLASAAPMSKETAGENRLCTIVQAEIVGLSDLATRLPPEELTEIAGRCIAVLSSCVEAMGGFVAKIVDDGLLAIFGAPVARENDAERAVHAALRMQAAFARTREQRALRRFRLSMRAGIGTGWVFAGHVGTTTRKDFTVVGDAVAVAARMRQSAPQGAVALGRDTLRHVVGSFDVEPLEKEGYVVVGPSTTRFRVPSTDFYGLTTKLVGRTAEMHRFDDALETAVAERRAAFVTVVAPHGMGSTRLLADLMARLAEPEGARVVLAARASQIEMDQSYALAVSLLRMRFAIHEDDLPPVIEQKLRRGAQEAAGADAGASEAGLDETIELVATLLGARPWSHLLPSSIAPDEGWEQAKSRMAAAVGRLVSLLAKRAPVVVLCDEIHWADDASLDLLGDLATRLSDVPMLLVCTARTELFDRRPLWGEGVPGHERIDLGPLARRHVEEMIRDRLRLVPELPPVLVASLAERAAGNPLVAAETLHLLVDSGILAPAADGAWKVQADRVRDLTLPATVQGVVQARLDRLSPDERDVLGVAAVIGDTFWEGAVAELRKLAKAAAGDVAAARAETPSLLARLRDRQLVRAREASTYPAEREYVFAEPAVREVAYEALGLRLRRAYEGAAAQWLAARVHAPGDAARVAKHWDRAGHYARAVAEYARAAANAASFGQNAEALRHYERIAEILDRSALGDDVDAEAGPALQPEGDDMRVATWRDRARLRIELGDVLRRLGRLDDAERSYAEARAAILRAERRASERPLLGRGEAALWEGRIDFRLALTHKVRGDTARARSFAESALARAAEAGAEPETPPIWAALAGIHRREGRLDACRDAALSGLRECRDIAQRDHRWRDWVCDLLLELGVVFFGKGQMIRAERCYRQAARVVDEGTNPRAAAFALNDVAAARYLAGDLAGALPMFLRSLALKERVGDLHQIAIAHSNVAEVKLRLGDAVSALEHARRSVRLGEQARAGSDLPEMYRNLAEAALATGQPEASLDAAEKAVCLARVAGGRLYLGEALFTLARVAGSMRPAANGHPEALARARAAARLVADELRSLEQDDPAHLRLADCKALLASLAR